MGFKDLADVVSVREPKVLPILGHQISFPGTVDAVTGQKLLLMVDAGRRHANSIREGGDGPDGDLVRLIATTGLDEQSMQDVENALLGDAKPKLDELGVWGASLNHIVATLMIWHVLGQESAEEFWEGKAPGATANRETRRRTGGSSSPTAGTDAPPLTNPRTQATHSGGGSSGRRRNRQTRR